nr:alpha/beta hydrolases superfamily protein [Tanacetum cinerariifolium]
MYNCGLKRIALDDDDDDDVLDVPSLDSRWLKCMQMGQNGVFGKPHEVLGQKGSPVHVFAGSRSDGPMYPGVLGLESSCVLILAVNWRNLALINTTLGQIHHKREIIQNKYKENLVGILHETGSKEVVIVFHGYRSYKDKIPMVNRNLAVAFSNKGISAFRFDFTGNGEGSFQYRNNYREVDDLRSVIKCFEQEKRFVTAIIGYSKGGNVVLFYALRFKVVNNVVNISGRFDLRRGIEGRLGKDYLKRMKQYGFIDVANRK